MSFSFPRIASAVWATLAIVQANLLAASDQQRLESMSNGIKEAIEVELFEGLPHQTFERELLAAEQKSKDTIQIHKYPFYRRPLPLSAADAAELRRLLSGKETYRPFRGEKRCGGFHPDYALAWKKGNRTIHVLICFGCGEFKLFAPSQELRTDAHGPAFTEIHTILQKYQDQRPKRNKG